MSRVGSDDLDARIDEFSPEVAATARAALVKMRKLLRGSHLLVYDNYNALAIGLSPTEKTSDIVCSITLYPRWVSLFFPRGAQLPDPARRLQGSGSKVRHIVLESARTLDEKPVRDLIAAAQASAPVRLDATNRTRVVLKMVAAKRRPRRPSSHARS